MCKYLRPLVPVAWVTIPFAVGTLLANPAVGVLLIVLLAVIGLFFFALS